MTTLPCQGCNGCSEGTGEVLLQGVFYLRWENVPVPVFSNPHSIVLFPNRTGPLLGKLPIEKSPFSDISLEGALK